MSAKVTTAAAAAAAAAAFNFFCRSRLCLFLQFSGFAAEGERKQRKRRQKKDKNSLPPSPNRRKKPSRGRIWKRRGGGS